MGHEVYANNMAISAKAADGKSICAFPDVCFTPPQTPATPPGVPIPYPNTGFASDTTDGSRTVKLKGKEVMLKNKSYFKKSTGDEAGCAPKKGIVTGKIQGKVYFIAWSMDVKIEGENVVRHLDMTTHNHASPTPNTPPMRHAEKMALGAAKDDPCKHPNDKKKKKYIIYEAQIFEIKNGKRFWTGTMYVGRTSGPPEDGAMQITNRRKAGHHRQDIGPLQAVCETDSYAAVRGAEELHQKRYESKNMSRSQDAKTKKKTQINPISPKNKRKDKYIKCAKQKNAKTCQVCAA